MLNPALENRVWMHTYTFALYRIRSTGIAVEPWIEYSGDDGKNWRTSSEYKTVKALVDDIEAGRLRMQFTPQPEDLNGVHMIREICQGKVNEITGTKVPPGAPKARLGERKGMLETYRFLIGLTDKYLERVRLPKAELPKEPPLDDGIDPELAKQESYAGAAEQEQLQASDTPPGPHPHGWKPGDPVAIG